MAVRVDIEFDSKVGQLMLRRHDCELDTVLFISRLLHSVTECDVLRGVQLITRAHA